MGGVGEKAFSSGQDLVEGGQDSDGSELRDVYAALYSEFRNFDKPIIGAINGSAMGAGLQLALLADYTVASENGRFGMTEIVVGFPCIFGSVLLWDHIGPSKTKELIFSGKLISASEGVSIGMFNQVSPTNEVWSTALKVAEEWAQKAPTVFKWDKAFYTALTEQHFRLAEEFAGKAYYAAYAAGEPQEYMTRFLEERRKVKAQAQTKTS